VRLSVVMPVYNEANTIEEAVRRVRDVRIAKEIIIVDDGSTDGTREILKSLTENTKSPADPLNEVIVFFQPENQGKGAAIKAGLAQGKGDIVLIQDADLEYDPQDYTKLLEPILAGHADVTYGSRFSGGGPHRVLYFWHYLGNHVLTLFSNMITNLNLSDMEVGYKVFKANVLKDIDIKSKRFGFEPEITVKLAKKGCRIYEVPISYYGRTYQEGKKITWKDGIVALYCLFRFRFWD
jgi:glycosyltransferase involved in cell wall biosynthesis